MRILFAEPNLSNARAIELMLNHSGFDCTICDSGEDIIGYAVNYRYDLILLNVTFSDISGFDVIRTIRQSRDDTPVLVLTEVDEITSKLKAFAVGADDYLTKPFHREELIARIHALIRRSKGLPSAEIQTVRMTTKGDEHV